jgi:hypothetical protein
MESAAFTAGRVSRFAPRMTAPEAPPLAGGKGRKEAERGGKDQAPFSDSAPVASR